MFGEADVLDADFDCFIDVLSEGWLAIGEISMEVEVVPRHGAAC
jgi:hypothetical protein